MIRGGAYKLGADLDIRARIRLAAGMPVEVAGTHLVYGHGAAVEYLLRSVH